jgi:adenine-specific DNA-methyltransferase
MTLSIDNTFESAYSEVVELSASFTAHESTYLGGSYSEAQARKDFIDPLFEALGWDVNHKTQRNPFEQEVVVERNVSTGQGQKRADYAFYLRPNFRDVRFFVEAKKPSLSVHADLDALFQTIRYGWNAGAVLSVLTSFAEVMILDCRSRPDPATAAHRVLHRFHFNEFKDPDVFSKFYWLFSHEAHETGAYARYCTSLPKPRGTARQLQLFKQAVQPVDEAFLDDLEDYRARLASLFKKADQSLDSSELTEVTQRTIDRLIFLRFLEDKLIENKVRVSQFGITGSAWHDFVAASRRLDGIYNGIVYKKHRILDDPHFSVDDAAFAEICDEVSDTNSPYDFNVIPIHILGSIYERFLGKVIVATDKRARVEPKPEVRKAGGVYYTPEYIVHYIVENTVGKKIAGKTPKQVLALKFADVACGSGSFLLGVFDAIIRHLTTWYNSNEQAAKRDGCVQLADGSWRLSLHQKREILLSTIFGVDIDHQAVEVTQLSLYLKLLEDETTSTAYEQQLEFEETLLPSLNKNIVCGNSLVGYEAPKDLFSLEGRDEIMQFDFKAAFPEIFRRSGGFDAIVGNPPYIRIQMLNEIHPATAAYVKSNYETARKGNFDLSSVFVERGFGLLNDQGALGYIVPNKFLKTDYGETLRSMLAQHKALSRVVDFGASQVFEATIYTCLLFLSRRSAKTVEYASCEASPIGLHNAVFERQPSSSFDAHPWSFASQATSELMARLEADAVPLLDLPAEMNRGSSSGDDQTFLVAEDDTEIEAGILRLPLFASDFGRFEFAPKSKLNIIFPYEFNGSTYDLIPEKKLKAAYPNAYKRLHSNKKKLEQRAQFRDWYAYSAPRNLMQHDGASIVVPLLANRGLAALIPQAQRRKICPFGPSTTGSGGGLPAPPNRAIGREKPRRS